MDGGREVEGVGSGLKSLTMRMRMTMTIGIDTFGLDVGQRREHISPRAC